MGPNERLGDSKMPSPFATVRLAVAWPGAVSDFTLAVGAMAMPRGCGSAADDNVLRRASAVHCPLAKFAAAVARARASGANRPAGVDWTSSWGQEKSSQPLWTTVPTREGRFG